MDTLMKADIFFFITAIAVVLVTIVFIVVLVYVAKILKDIKYITKKAKSEADLIAEDLSELRHNVKEKGAKLKYFFDFFNNLHKKKK